MNSQKQERMIVFILGNGFDLAHGLNTRYTDFLDGYPKEELQKNIWFRHFNDEQKEIGENWFNLEQEIYNVITKVQSEAISRVSLIQSTQESFYDFFKRELNNGYVIMSETEKKHIAEKLYEGIEEYSLRFFVDQFGAYLREQLDDLNLTPKPKFQEFLKNKILKEYNKIRIVNFNYTNTFEKLYRDYLYSKDGTLDISTYYVHGSLEENNLVLGTQNLPDEDKSSPFRIFTKETQRFRYETNKDYQELLNELGEANKKFITFHIIGHSLDKVDHKILRGILCYSGSKDNIRDINIYRYKDNESLEIQKNMEEILQYSCEERVSTTPLETII